MFVGNSEPVYKGEGKRTGRTAIPNAEDGLRARKKPSAVSVGVAALACAVAICAIVGAGFAPQLEVESNDSASLGDIVTGDFEDAGSNAVGVEKSDISGNKATMEEICVYVTGAVEKPGVYDLSNNARVNDAVDAAGGLRADAAASSVNLARLLSDGEQINIPTKAQVKDAMHYDSQIDMAFIDDFATNSNGLSCGTKVNINTASVAELQVLPGIGETLASRIVEDRTVNGPFVKPSDLTRVSGIGEKKFAEMEGMVSVG